MRLTIRSCSTVSVFFVAVAFVFALAFTADFFFAPLAAFDFLGAFAFAVVLFFALAGMYYLVLLLFAMTSSHLVGNILLEALAYTFKRDALEDRIKETFHNDLLGFSLRNTT